MKNAILTLALTALALPTVAQTCLPRGPLYVQSVSEISGGDTITTTLHARIFSRECQVVIQDTQSADVWASYDGYDPRRVYFKTGELHVVTDEKRIIYRFN